MSSGKIDALKAALGMGARSNKYRVIINGVGGGPTGSIVDTLAKNTIIPARSFNDVEIWNQGRLTTIAGSADFSGTWSITFIDKEDHHLRKKFIAWMEFIDSVANHSKEAPDHSSYMTSGEVHQLSTIDNSSKAIYTFEDIWPKSISDSSVADDSTDLIEFTVEFNYSSWKVS